VNGTAAERILSAASGKRVVVLGDLMLDRFIWGTVGRISPEAPVPVVRVGRDSFHLGGAGNVVNNISALGGVALPVGVTGTDESAAKLREALGALDASTEGILEIPGRITTVKTRIVAHNQQVVRFDREQDDEIDGPGREALTAKALRLCDGADALIISDYEKGCVTPATLEAVLPAARERGIPVVADPKPAHWKSYRPITAVTPNLTEAALMTGMRLRSEEEQVAASVKILETLGCRAVLLTRGDRGMLMVEAGADPMVIEASSRQVYDVTGAGDTVVATLALCLAGGASLRDAAVLANAAAGVVVSKVGTATADSAEILSALAGRRG
jgi:D-beta-D-heptose 7-phosphate kinase/D-beta-D-heptose 1-phosphate adenosyltransferase